MVKQGMDIAEFTIHCFLIVTILGLGYRFMIGLIDRIFDTTCLDTVYGWLDRAPGYGIVDDEDSFERDEAVING